MKFKEFHKTCNPNLTVMSASRLNGQRDWRKPKEIKNYLPSNVNLMELH
jgi:hypothetical protein